MTERTTETYDEWLERTKPMSRSGGVGWQSWVGIAAGLTLIFGVGAVLLGVIVLGTSTSSVVRWLLGPLMDSEKVKRRVSTVWTGVWALGATVALIREHDRGWAWWTLLAGTVILVAVECGPRFRRTGGRAS